jgi:hypothetical protein
MAMPSPGSVRASPWEHSSHCASGGCRIFEFGLNGFPSSGSRLDFRSATHKPRQREFTPSIQIRTKILKHEIHRAAKL